MAAKKDADYAKDMKLPFKTHDFSCYNLAIQDLPKLSNSTFQKLIFLKKNK